LAAAPVNITGPLVSVGLVDTVVNWKAEVVVVPVITEEVGIGGATDEVVGIKIVDDVVVGMAVGVEVGQLIEDSSEDKARQILSTLNEERMKRLR
jgi:CheY-specific phosphatase CheX